jgi:hypothetical protein
MNLLSLSPRLVVAISIILVTASHAPAQSALYFSGTANSWVTHGETELITPANGAITFNNGYSYDQGLHLNITTTAGENWALDIGTSNRGPLTVGFYTNATRFPFNNGSTPGLSFTGNGRGDNQVAGWFNVLGVTYSNSTLISASVDFVQYDETLLYEKTSGFIRYNTNATIAPDFTLMGVTNGGVNNGISFAWSASPGQVFQLQYCTNLPATNWLNLGSPITAGNNVVSATDTNLADRQRLYRLKRSLP